uniref:Nop domain-containing protein n=1 Tax=Polytomella parva TaxID=51329 RepID=A0A7S0YG14_9CHLO
MLLLFETPAGFALFKVQKDKLKDASDVAQDFQTLESAQKIVKLKAFTKFENTTEALAAATALVDSKLSKGLKKFLKKNVGEEELAVLDKKLGGIIQEKLEIACQYSSSILELSRGVRSQLSGLIGSLAGVDLRPMSLGLSHSLSRYKLKFSPDKVDTMIVQAIGLLDDLDKELNIYAMRVREWYGWHFPEMTKIVSDNIKYAKVVKFMGIREKSQGLDFSSILEEDIEQQLKDAAQISMGTEISQDDLSNIQMLADQVIELSEYRAQLYDYLKSRMTAIAPNVTVLVGELVGARLISHAGSLINLAKQPASTVQILGAEKALFRALKTKHDTPKYGLIYHASLVGQSQPKYKGKISRSLSAKAALAIRVDALGDYPDASVGLEAREKIEARLRQIDDSVGKSQAAAAPTKSVKTFSKAPSTAPAKSFNADADVVSEKKKRKRDNKE